MTWFIIGLIIGSLGRKLICKIINDFITDWETHGYHD